MFIHATRPAVGSPLRHVTYGAIAGAIVGLLWLYLSGLALLVGPGVDAEIGHATVERAQPSNAGTRLHRT